MLIEDSVINGRCTMGYRSLRNGVESSDSAYGPSGLKEYLSGIERLDEESAFVITYTNLSGLSSLRPCYIHLQEGYAPSSKGPHPQSTRKSENPTNETTTDDTIHRLNIEISMTATKDGRTFVYCLGGDMMIFLFN